jgi:hypothetical protein
MSKHAGWKKRWGKRGLQLAGYRQGRAQSIYSNARTTTSYSKSNARGSERGESGRPGSEAEKGMWTRREWRRCTCTNQKLHTAGRVRGKFEADADEAIVAKG